MEIFVAVALTQNKWAIVDYEDKEKVWDFKWYANQCAKHGVEKWYARRTVRQKNGKRKGVYMHRSIMVALRHENVVDHRNGNGLDNRRSSNLFETTQTLNVLRSSFYCKRI